MEEKANFYISFLMADFLSQHLRQKHEMIVVYPDQVSVVDMRSNGACKLLVSLSVRFPIFLDECDFAWVIVEERPQNGVCEDCQLAWQ